MDVFPSVSKSVPVSAVVRLAAVEEGVLGVRNLNSAEWCIQSVSHSQLRPKVRLSTLPSHITQWVFSRQWGQIGVSNMRECVVGGLRRIFTPQTNGTTTTFSLLVCDIQCRRLYKKSSSSAWCRDTRSPWVEIRQKGILCYTGRQTQAKLF